MPRRPLCRAILGLAGGALLVLAMLDATRSASAASSRRLRRLVVVGDSLLAGFSNGGLVGRGQPGQRDGAAALIARRARVGLPQAMMGRPGFPPPLRIDDGNGNGELDPGEVRRRLDRGVGFRRDADTETRNLAVPGETIRSVFEDIAPLDVAAQVIGGDVNGRDVMKFAILGLPLREDGVSQVRVARERRPSFILLWLGSNDVLGMATHTSPTAAGISAIEFGVQYRRLLNALADTGAPMAAANLPDVTGVAALRRAASEVTACRRADGTLQPVAADDLLSIYLDRALLPEPPCDRVLDAAEQTAVRDVVTRFNLEIAAAVADVEASRGIRIALVDVFALFDRLRQTGFDVRGDGSLVVTTRYLGGVFSLDGVHPTKTGHALIANAFIDGVNARFGEAIPAVGVARIAARDRLAASPFAPAGEVPFGVVAGTGDTVEDAFDRIEDHLSDFADDVEDLLDDF